MNKIAVVTGASTGIGREISIALSQLGYNLALVARRKDELLQTNNLLKKTGKIFVADLSEIQAINKLIQEVKNTYTKIDLLANIAGIWHDTTKAFSGIVFDSYDQKVILDTLNVGLTAPVLLAHGFLPVMSKGSYIINLSGTFESGAAGWLPYYVSKRGIEDLTIALSQDLQNRDVKVFGISPSDTATEEYTKFFPSDAATAQGPQMIAQACITLLNTAQNGKVYVIKNGEVSERFHY